MIRRFLGAALLSIVATASAYVAGGLPTPRAWAVDAAALQTPAD